MKFCGFSILCAVGLWPVISGLAATSELWGTAGEAWDATYPASALSGRIADVSFAGYRRGCVPIPTYPVAVDVTHAPYLAIPNDGLDDSAAIQAAIEACPTNGAAVYLPAGTFDIQQTLILSKPNMVLRGAGPGKTVLSVTNGIKGIHLIGDGDSRAQYTEITGLKRGDWKLTNATVAVNATVGDLLYFRKYFAEKTPEYDAYIEERIGGVQTAAFSGWVSIYTYVQVEQVSGDVVILDRPIEYTHTAGAPAWQVGRVSATIQDAGIEDLTITYSPDYPFRKHFNGTQVGAAHEEDENSRAIGLTDTINCWVRNVQIKEAAYGIDMYGFCAHCSLQRIHLTAERLSQSEFPLKGEAPFKDALLFDTPLQSNYWDAKGHHGIILAGRFNLAEQIKIDVPMVHDLTVNETENCVFSEIQAVDLSLDHHRRMPSRNLWTQIDAGLGRKLWLSSGAAEAGIQCGAWETFWNIQTDMDQPWPQWDPIEDRFSRGFLNVVGLNHADPAVTNAAPAWFEGIRADEIEPKNLYEAMRTKRYAEKGWDAEPPTAQAEASVTTGVAPLTVQFTGSGSTDNVGVVSYAWDFGDGFTSREADPQHTYTTPGIYDAVLTVRDGRNLRAKQVIKMTVEDPNGYHALSYELAGSAALENAAYSFANHVMEGRSNQLVVTGGTAQTVKAVAAPGYRFVAWSDGVMMPERTDTNVQESAMYTAYFTAGSDPVTPVASHTETGRVARIGPALTPDAGWIGAVGSETAQREVIWTDSQQIMIGQSFFLPSQPLGDKYSLSGIVLQSSSDEDWDAYPGRLQIKLFASDQQNDGLLATYSFTLSDFGDGSSTPDISVGEWVEFSWDTPLELTPGAYSFLIFFEQSSGANNLHKWSFMRDITNPYVDGAMFEGAYGHTPPYISADWAAASWNNSYEVTNRDLHFFVKASVVQPPDGYALWAVSHGVSGSALDDEDDDGLSNLVEYAFELDPKKRTQSRPLTARTDLANHWFIGQFTPEQTDVLYRVETATNLLQYSWTPLPTPAGITGVPIAVPVSNTAPQQYLRLRIERE